MTFSTLVARYTAEPQETRGHITNLKCYTGSLIDKSNPSSMQEVCHN